MYPQHDAISLGTPRKDLLTFPIYNCPGNLWQFPNVSICEQLPKSLVNSQVKIALRGPSLYRMIAHCCHPFRGYGFWEGAYLGFCSCPWILSLPALGSYTIIKAVADVVPLACRELPHTPYPRVRVMTQ